MPKSIAPLLPGLLLIATATPALADDSAEIENLRHRLEKLEAKETEKAGFAIKLGQKKLNFWGALEVEAGYRDRQDQPAASDLSVATALLGADVKVGEQISGRLALLHEDGEEQEVALDEAHLSVSRPESMGGEAKITAGRNHLPFGTFTSIMVSDPLTLELGEITRTALLAAWTNGKVALQVGIFNGDRDTTDHNRIDDGVAALTVTPSEQISFGVSYLSDLAESKAELLGYAATGPEEKVSAASANFTLKFAPITVSVEYLGALNKFSEALRAAPDHAPELSGRQPRAWFAEVNFAPGEDWALSGRYEQAKDYQDDMARSGATFSYGLEANTTLSLEYLYSDFARENMDTANQVTVQLAMEF